MESPLDSVENLFHRLNHCSMGLMQANREFALTLPPITSITEVIGGRVTLEYRFKRYRFEQRKFEQRREAGNLLAAPSPFNETYLKIMPAGRNTSVKFRPFHGSRRSSLTNRRSAALACQNHDRSRLWCDPRPSVLGARSLATHLGRTRPSISRSRRFHGHQRKGLHLQSANEVRSLLAGRNYIGRRRSGSSIGGLSGIR